MPIEIFGTLSGRVLQGLEAIEEAKAKLINEPPDAGMRENMRQNLAVMRKSVMEDVSQLRRLGLLELRTVG